MTADDILTSSGKYMRRKKLATPEIVQNATELARRLTMLLTSFNSFSRETYERRVSSGFRDPASNKAAGGATHSAHLEGRAADIEDADGKLKKFCVLNQDLLKHFDLWMEAPEKTPTWCHLQSRPIPGEARIFEP